MGALPSAVGGGGVTAQQIAPVITQLQQVVAQLSQLVAQLAATTPVTSAQGGAAALGGGSGCGGNAGASALAGAGSLGTETQGAMGAPTAARDTKTSRPTTGTADAKRAGTTPPPTAATQAGGPSADIAVPRHNPRSVTEAIDWAKKQADNPSQSWDRLCLSFVAHAYGWSASGVPYAIDHYSAVPRSMRHDGDRTPPPGALVYWDTGQRAGHVALYLGNGMIASNDIRQKGRISIVPMDEIDRKWGAKYIGWTPPYFPKGAA